MVRRLVLLVGAVAVACAFSGCVTLIVKHTPLPAAAASIGSVSLVVNNTRAKDEGGEDPMSVGRVRNLYGMPIKQKADNNVIEAMKALQIDALANAGYKVVDGSPTQIVVDVNRLFMDGYMGYKVDVVLNIKAVNGGASSFEKTITESNGFYYKKPASMYEAYDTLMNVVARASVGVYKSAEFQAAVK